jgi:Protein of unknown function (DUF2752).
MPRVQILLSLAGLLLLTAYYLFDPAVHPFPQCPSYWLTGLQCPGCGSQRALHQLLHGHFREALQHNSLMVVGLPYVLFGLLLEYTAWGRRQESLKRKWYGRTAARIAFAAIVVFTIGRNLVSLGSFSQL